MKRIAIASCIVGVLGGAVWAEQMPQAAPQLTEQQKRKLILPHIAAATDCVADHVRQRADLAEAVQQGRLKTLVVEALPMCRSELRRLADGHDHVYGIGTGIPFVSGPYLSDLERATLSRVRTEVERQTTLAEQRRQEERSRLEFAEAERQKRLSVLRDSQKLLVDKAHACANGKIASLVKGGDRAEVVAEAAMTLCHADIAAAIDAVHKTVEAETGVDRRTRETEEMIRGALRKNIQANAVVARAQQAETPRASPQTRATSGDEASRRCLTSAHKALGSSTVEKYSLIRSMVEICRPEIEAEARTAFFDSPSKPLDEARSDALKRAADFSDSLIGVRH